MSGFDSFHSKEKGYQAWLKPASSTGFEAVYNALAAVFPSYVSKSHAYVPHLSLGQWKTQDEMNKDLAAFDFKAIIFEVNCVYLIAREDDSPFSVRYSVPLFSGGYGINYISRPLLHDHLNCIIMKTNSLKTTTTTTTLEIKTDDLPIVYAVPVELVEKKDGVYLRKGQEVEPLIFTKEDVNKFTKKCWDATNKCMVKRDKPLTEEEVECWKQQAA